MQKQESVSLRTTKITAAVVIPGLGLVQEGLLMVPTRVETRLDTTQIMATYTLLQWVTFLFNKTSGYEDKPFKSNGITTPLCVLGRNFTCAYNQLLNALQLHITFLFHFISWIFTHNAFKLHGSLHIHENQATSFFFFFFFWVTICKGTCSCFWSSPLLRTICMF